MIIFLKANVLYMGNEQDDSAKKGNMHMKNKNTNKGSPAIK